MLPDTSAGSVDLSPFFYGVLMLNLDEVVAAIGLPVPVPVPVSLERSRKWLVFLLLLAKPPRFLLLLFFCPVRLTLD